MITDLKMPGLSGIELLKQMRSQYPGTVVIILTAFGTVETAVQAMKAGAYDYLTKPVDSEEMSLVVGRALEHLRLVRECSYYGLASTASTALRTSSGIQKSCCRSWKPLPGLRTPTPRC